MHGGRYPEATSQPISPSVNEVILAFWKHAESHYGEGSKELKQYRYSLRPLRAMYGEHPADKFTPKCFCGPAGHSYLRTYSSSFRSRRCGPTAHHSVTRRPEPFLVTPRSPWDVRSIRTANRNSPGRGYLPAAYLAISPAGFSMPLPTFGVKLCSMIGTYDSAPGPSSVMCRLSPVRPKNRAGLCEKHRGHSCTRHGCLQG